MGRRRENSLGAPDEPLVGTSWEHYGGNPTSWASRGDRGDGRMKSYLFNPAGGIKKSPPRLNGPAVYYFSLLLWGPRPGPRRSPSGRQVAPPRRFGLDSFLCAGKKPQGSFHWKVAVVDRRYLYSSRSNFTYASPGNEELCFRISGPMVGQVLERLSSQRLQRKPWDGS